MKAVLLAVVVAVVSASASGDTLVGEDQIALMARAKLSAEFSECFATFARCVESRDYEKVYATAEDRFRSAVSFASFPKRDHEEVLLPAVSIALVSFELVIDSTPGGATSCAAIVQETIMDQQKWWYMSWVREVRADGSGRWTYRNLPLAEYAGLPASMRIRL